MKPAFRNLIIVPLIALALQACGALPAQPTQTPFVITATPAPSGTSTPTLVSTPTEKSGPTDTPTATSLPPNEYMVISLADNTYQHLFLYSPETLPFTRLTDGTHDDITPAISPDGRRIAFASRRNGQFDLYTLNLKDGNTVQLTDTKNYEANPSWSPDGQWLVYETNASGNLDIAIAPADDPSQAPITLTDDPAADHSPAWSPRGRLVVFVSNRSGNDEIWLANLDVPGDGRFTNLSNNPAGSDLHPAWSADGRYIAWASSGIGGDPAGIYIIEPADPASKPRYLGEGAWPTWSGSQNQLATIDNGPNSFALSGYKANGLLALPVIPLPGVARGLSWGMLDLPDPLPDALKKSASTYPTPIWVPVLSGGADIPADRKALVQLKDVQAPYPQLQDSVDDSFSALRKRLINETGWDVLASLENAYVPVSIPPNPGFSEDWLYTGRAFALNPVTLNAGWMLVVPEYYGDQLYWRVYIRPQVQDGSQGEPLRSLPFDLTARFNYDPNAYDSGGKSMDIIPSGYWVDLTALASQFGWQRLAALPNWRTYFKGTRFNEFVLRDGLDWRSAMLEIYPPEILITPTPVQPPAK